MNIHVRVVSPVTTHDPRTHDLLRQLASPGVVLDAVEIDEGPQSIECEADEALAIPDTLRKIVAAERAGVDAVVIDCMGDPGLAAARKQVRIPVLGPSEVSMHTAAMLGDRLAIVTVVETVRPAFERLCRDYGMQERVASMRAIGVPVLDIERNPGLVEQLLCEESLAAVEQDGASVVVLGCTGFLGVADSIAKYLCERTGGYVPVIDPIPLSVYTAIAWVRGRLRQREAGPRGELLGKSQ